MVGLGLGLEGGVRGVARGGVGSEHRKIKRRSKALLCLMAILDI